MDCTNISRSVRSYLAGKITRWKHEGSSITALTWPWWLATGLLAVPFQADLYPVSLAIAFFLCAVASFKFKLLRSISILLFGAVWATVFAMWVLSGELEEETEGVEVTVVGRILGVPKLTERYAQFNFSVDRLNLDDREMNNPNKIRLRWYGKDLPDLSPNDKWKFLVKLKRPHGSANPATFDYEAWLFSQRLRATGYIRKGETAMLLSKASTISVNGFRARFAEFLEQAALRQSAIIAALSIGLRQKMTDSQWATLQNTGTNHLVAISGLHIGLVAGLLYFVGSFIWSHTLLTRTFYPTQKAAWAFSLLGGITYAALAGFAIPTKRAMLMLISVAALYFMGRRPGPWFSLGLVLSLVLLFDPLAPLSMGFWLSFLAVGFILLSARNKTLFNEGEEKQSSTKRFCLQWIGRAVSFINIQWALLIGLAPILLLTFHKVSLVAFVANLLAVPFIGLVVVPLILIGAFFFSIGLHGSSLWFINLADQGIDWVWPYLQWLSESPFAIWQHSIDWPLALVAIMGSVGLLIRRFGYWRWLFPLAWMPAIFITPIGPKPGDLWLNILDVGQGLAIVVQTHQHTLLYDFGPSFDGGFDAGESIIVPYLRYTGVRHIDMAVISHDNNDHSGGYAAVESQFAINQFLAGPNEDINNSEPCLAGHTWEWDGVYFEFIYPFRSTIMQGNNGSCVLKITHAKGAILLTGDIEKEAESELLSEIDSADILQSSILIAPHHGSKSSSTDAFVSAVSPEIVVFSAGYKSRFNHPHPSVSATYMNAGAKILSTANTGRIRFKYSHNGLSTEIYRVQNRHFWQ